MTHRERVIAALNHEEPDRCPMQASFTPEFAERLRAGLSTELDELQNPPGSGNTYDIERALGLDLLLTSVGWQTGFHKQAGTYVDEWGVMWKSIPYATRFGGGYYTETVGHPLAGGAALRSYKPPDPHRPQLYEEARRLIRDFKNEYWIVGVTKTTIFETAWALRGLEQLMMDFVEDPDLADAILEIPYRYHLAAAEKLVAMGVDMIWLGDDVGAQNSMMISPRHWRRYLKPRMAHFIATLKTINPQLKVAYHSDGCIYPIIPELIEIGLDVLNPIQPASMDPVRLKREYGNRLCFWGSVDEQHTLPFGSPEDVRGEVLSRLKTIGGGGGLILGPTHNVQMDTPLENFRAMVDTIANTSYKSLARDAASAGS